MIQLKTVVMYLGRAQKRRGERADMSEGLDSALQLSLVYGWKGNAETIGEQEQKGMM